jgi:murein DD-endopeptidase MepM/ murein hydrolase activator NlpD
MVLVSLLALYAAASAPHAFAAQAAPPSSKSGGKRRVRKPTARTVRKPARKPLPPPAEIPAVVESASVWRGCLESQDLPKLASGLGMEPTRLAALVEEMDSASAFNQGGSQGGDCIAYVAATGGEAGVASVIFRRTEPSGETRTLAFHKTSDGIITTPGVCDCREFTRRVLSLPAREFTASINSVSASIPSNVRWQLDILVPRMIRGLSATRKTEKESAKPASDGEPEAGNLAGESAPWHAGAPVDSYTVRVVVGRYADDERERLDSVEIVEPVSGRRVNGAWWLDRPDGPGVIIGMDGVAYERLLWESPVKYLRSSRGVGASVTTWRRRVPAKKGSAKSTVVRTVRVPGYHLGVDMSAPRGTDVHAVGDAKVSFAGRRRGFGNLIILDHGRGYQTYYAHLSKIRTGIKPGVQVARGDMIGLVGSTGRSTAPHLHFETRKDGRYLDPFDETHQLGFWLLTADEQERLAMQLLSAAPVVADENLVRR